MAGNDNKTTFTVALDDKVSTPSKEAAAAVGKLRDSIGASSERIGEMQAALRRLRGDSDAVKNAKAELKKRLDAERAAVTANSLELLKHNASLKKTAAETKAAADATEASASRMKLAKNVVMGATAAYVAFAAAAAGVAIGLAKVTLGQANAERTANLFREAAYGDAANAKRLGDQVDLLATKLPTARTELNDLAVSLAKGGLQGQTLVDTFNAVGQATAAMGDEAGSKIREFVDRGRLMKRFQLGARELVNSGTGIEFKDVAQALADNMKVGVNEAAQALVSGRVTLEAGAGALKSALEKKLGSVNLRRMLDLNVLLEKAKEKFDKMTRGINLEPLLKAFESLSRMLDEDTVTGRVLKDLVGRLGTDLAEGLASAVPLAKALFEGLLLGSLKAELAYLRMRVALKGVFGEDILKDADLLNAAFKVGEFAVRAIGTQLEVMAITIGTLIKLATGLGRILSAVGNAKIFGGKGNPELDNGPVTDPMSGVQMGTATAEGIKKGLEQGPARDAVKKLGEDMKSDFRFSLGIASPSKVFAKYGEYTAQGFEKGVDKGAPDATAALDNMMAKPANPGGGSGGGSTSATITVNFNGSAGGGGNPSSKAEDDEFQAKLTKALEDALIAAGIPAIINR